MTADCLSLRVNVVCAHRPRGKLCGTCCSYAVGFATVGFVTVVSPVPTITVCAASTGERHDPDDDGEELQRQRLAGSHPRHTVVVRLTLQQCFVAVTLSVYKTEQW